MNVKLTEFSRQDWLAFAGCEMFKLIAPEVELTICGNSIDIPRGFAGNADPLIGELEDDIGRKYLVIADGECVTVHPAMNDEGRCWEYAVGAGPGWTPDSAKLLVAALPAPWQYPALWDAR